MRRVVFDPHLVAVGLAFANTPARQLLVTVGYAKLIAVAERSDAALADEVGGEVTGRGAVEVSLDELSWIRGRLPDQLPEDIGLIAAQPLMADAAELVESSFAAYPPLRSKAKGLRADLLAFDYVNIPKAVEEGQDRLVYCALEYADMLVSDHHPVVQGYGGRPYLVEDPMSGRSVLALSSAALVGMIGRPLRSVDGTILEDVCMLLKPGRNGA